MEPMRQTPVPPARETLQGDRLCMQCLHPLAGREIEREPSTGLRFVRCGECGTASALFDYPTAAPWLARGKMVVASTLVVFLLLAGVALAGVAGGFSAGIAAAASEESGDSLATAFSRSSAASKADKTVGVSGWGAADDAWLETDEGRTALDEARWSRSACFILLGAGALGSALATPPAVFLAIALMRIGAVRRAALVALPALLGAGLAGLYLHSYNRIFAGIGPGMNWRAVASVQHGWLYSALACAWFTAWSAVLALAAPSIAALLARLVVPPRDRRLVAWIWE